MKSKGIKTMEVVGEEGKVVKITEIDGKISKVVTTDKAVHNWSHEKVGSFVDKEGHVVTDPRMIDEAMKGNVPDHELKGGKAPVTDKAPVEGEKAPVKKVEEAPKKEVVGEEKPKAKKTTKAKEAPKAVEGETVAEVKKTTKKTVKKAVKAVEDKAETVTQKVKATVKKVKATVKKATKAKTVVKKSAELGGKALAFSPLAFLAWEYYSSGSLVSSILTCTRDFMWPGAVVVAAYMNASPF